MHSNSYRLLKIKDILFYETDAEHELSIADIQEKLKRYLPEETFDQRTIKRDLMTLEEAGFEIVRNKGKYGKILYSHQARLFEVYQLRLLVDAILSARFITTKEKNHLIEKVKQLTSHAIAKTLPEPVVFSQSVNLDYDLIKLNIDHVHRAISKRRVLTYKYGRYNMDKEFEWRRDGETYYVEPYALIWQNDLYYLIGRFQPTNEIRHYRLDRIRDIHISDETFKKDENFHLQQYIDKSFHMFSGENIRIRIKFHASLVNVVLDRFGKDANIRKVNDEAFILSTQAKLSDGLINWILTWGSRAKVLSPDYLVQQVKEKISQMYAIYH